MRAPFASEWKTAYDRWPKIPVKVCRKAEEKRKIVIHPDTEVCSYCRPKGSNSQVVDFPRSEIAN